jgi:hypothetical protein
MASSTPFPCKQIYILSDHADSVQNGWHVFKFNEILSIPNNYSFLLSCVDAQLPYSFYSISEARDNHALHWMHRNAGSEESHDFFSLNLADGNYSIYEILDKMVEVDQSLTYIYNESTNKVTITTIHDIELTSPFEPLAAMLGFDATQYDIADTNSITSKGIVNLSGLQSIYVRTSFITQNIDTRVGGLTNVLCKIHILTASGQFFSWENVHGFKVRIREKHISSVVVRLEDENSNSINLNGQSFQMTIQLDVYKPDKIVKLRRHRDILDMDDKSEFQGE